MHQQRKPVVVGVGEVLWDLLPDGKALGGAPANFVYIANLLGCDAAVVTCVGDDALGHEALAALRNAGLRTEYCSIDPAHATGTAGVELRDGQPRFTIAEDVAWDHIPLTDSVKSIARHADAICFGSLAQRSVVSRETIGSCMAEANRAIRVFDCNLRQEYYTPEILADSLLHATIAKLNDLELPIVAKAVHCESSPDALREKYDLDLVCVTRGEYGSVMAGREETVEHSGFPTQVVDAIGAGDAFTAAMTVAMLRRWPLRQVAAFANSWGSFVASRRGAMPAVTAEEIASIEQRALSTATA